MVPIWGSSLQRASAYTGQNGAFSVVVFIGVFWRFWEGSARSTAAYHCAVFMTAVTQ